MEKLNMKYVCIITDVQTTRFDIRVFGPFDTEADAKHWRTRQPTAKYRTFRVVPLLRTEMDIEP